jgi:heme a synthase
MAAVLRRLALASLIANIGIVITGGAVRLTGSGLGCSTWPRCTASSYVPTPELGIHGAIEFGNRMLTGAVGLLAAACLIAALRPRPRRRNLVTLSALVLAGIPAQAALGGITVLTELNPWWVGGHFLLSMVVIALAYALFVLSAPSAGSAGSASAGSASAGSAGSASAGSAGSASAGSAGSALPRALRQLVGVVVAVSAAVLVAGTVVTGSGPHAGDEDARRNGLDPQLVAQLHADLVALLVGLSVALWFALRAVGAPAAATRAAGVLVLVELAQGLVGVVQHVTHLPVILVGVHMAGACAVWLATLTVLAVTRTRAPAQPPVPARHEALVNS